MLTTTEEGSEIGGSAPAGDGLHHQVRHALAWSLTDSVLTRVVTFGFNIILARILAPADFGVFAIALAALTVLQSANELGVSVALMRWPGDATGPARTATSIALTSSVVFYLIMFPAVPLLASQLHSPAATGVVRLLMLAVVLDGVSCIPSVMLNRAFLQRRRTIARAVATLTTITVTVALAAAHHGPWALAWGTLAGNVVVAVLMLALAPVRPRPGFDIDHARALLRVGLPLAGASLLLFAMLNVDYVVIAHVLDSTSLGLYLLAFNVASWPPGLLTLAIRQVSIPAFATLSADPARLREWFSRSFGLLMGLALPAAAILVVLARPLVQFVYGSTWRPAVVALEFLAVLGAIRIALDFAYDLLVAVGRSRTVLGLQLLWLVLLIPAIWIGASTDGIRGAAVAHVIVAAGVVGPAYLIALHRCGVRLTDLAARVARPLLAAAAVAALAVASRALVPDQFLALALAGTAAIVAVGAITRPWQLVGRLAADQPSA
jgi:PST family polysaccharide transporter